MRSRIIVHLTLLALPLGLLAQKSVTDFSLKNVVDGQTVDLSAHKGNHAVVVVFTSNYCPYAKLYEERLIELHSTYRNKNVRLLLINPNHPEASPEDTEAKMAERAKEKGFPFPYLADKGQTAARMFNARKTPEAFVLTPHSTGFHIVYQGAIDDNPQSSGEVRDYHLKDAIDLVLVGKRPAENFQRPTGCMIRGN